MNDGRRTHIGLAMALLIAGASRPALAQGAGPGLALRASDEAAARGRAAAHAKWRVRHQPTFDVTSRGPEGVFVGTGADIGPSWSIGRGELSVAARFQLAFVPYRIEKDGGVYSLNSAFTYGAVVGYARPVSDDIWLSGQLGPMVDLMSIRFTSGSNPSLRELPSAGASWRPKAFGSLGLWLDLGPFIYTFTATVGIPLVHAHDDVEDSMAVSGRRELLVPWAVQPGFSLGILF